MTSHPFYKQHWLDIEEERLRQYQDMFAWNDGAQSLYEPAAIHEGQTVADFGCGPGHTALEIAKWVGVEGKVFGFDINSDFVSMANDNAADCGLSQRVTFLQSDGHSLPLPDVVLDRVTTRNTLIYVDDPMQTLLEFHRTLKPGGRVHAIEGDWGLMSVEPLPCETWRQIVVAASRACRTPNIGRKLTGLLARCGFRDIHLDVVTRPDLTGRLLPMIRNMIKYAGEAVDGGLDAINRELREALDKDVYLCVAPQFVATAIR